MCASQLGVVISLVTPCPGAFLDIVLLKKVIVKMNMDMTWRGVCARA